MEAATTILLVEDEFILAANERQQLEGEGYRVIHVHDGAGAIAAVEGNASIGLVLMDIDLGKGMDGTEAALEILSRRDLPLLFLSSHIEKDIVQRTERITNFGYVVKDSSFTVLDASIKMALKLFASQAAVRKANAELAFSEEKFSKAFFSQPDPVLVARVRDGRIIDANHGFTKVFGYSREEVIGRSTLPGDLGIWVDAADRERCIGELVSKGEVDSFEAQCRTKDGSVVIGILSGRPLVIEGEDCLIVIVKDYTAQRRLERSVREGEDRFRMAFLNAPFGISLTEFDGSLPTVNQAFCDMLGYRMEEINRSDFLSLTHPDDRARSGELAGRLREGACATARFEKRFLHKDGHVVWADVSMSLLKDGQGAPRCFITEVVDITEAKAREAALRASEASLRKSQEVAHLGSWKWHIKSNRLEWSDEMYRIFGIERASFTGSLPDVIARAIHPDDRAKVDASNRMVADEGKSIPLQYRIRLEDGSVRTVWAEAGELLLDEAGQPEVLTGIVRDITAQAIEEADRKTEAELFSSAFHHISAMSLLIDPDSAAILDANQAAARFYGRPVEELKRMKITDISALPPEETKRELERASAEKRSYFIFKHRLADGTVRDVEVHSSPLEVKGRRLLHSIIHDITERRELEAKVANLLMEKELLLREAHHRVKNNMGTISSLLALHSDASDDPGVRSVLIDTMAQVQGMGILYDKLYRAESTASLSLPEYFHDMMREALALFGKHGQIALSVELPELELPSKWLADLGIVVNELLTNSVKYAFAAEAAPAISFVGELAGKRLRLVYSDNGRGLPEGFRLDGGEGLGTRIISGMVSQIGGTVRAENRDGARFVMEFDV